MPLITPATLRHQIATGGLEPVYLLVGADEVERAAVAAEIVDAVEEGLRAFNVSRLYGGESGVDDLIDAAATLPVLSPRRVVVMLKAERFLVPRSENEADQRRLEAFLHAPPAHATIVFVAGVLDQRRRVVKQLQKEAQVVDCGTIEHDADAEHWVKVRAAREKVNLDPAAVRALVARCGPDIRRLRAGLERVALYALGQPTITAEDVGEAVPAAPEAPGNFGIANAIERNDVKGALRELQLALEAGAPHLLVMGQLRAAAERLPGPRLRSAVEAVFRTDLALKSSGGDPRILLERLVVELTRS